MREFPWGEVRQALRVAQRVAVVSHVRPDGDAVGSVLGLGWALRAAGKQVSLALADGVPLNLRHLPGAEDIAPQVAGEVDWIIVVDASDRGRVGTALPAEAVVDLNIDHHKTNTAYARYNLVNPEAVSTTAVLVEFIAEMGLPLPQEAAEALLTGLITDTIGFRTANMSPQALRLAADLMEKGADLSTLYFKALVERTYEALRYWGAGLSRLQREGPLVWTALTLADREAVGYPGNDDADLVNLLSAVQGALIAVIFIEQSDGTVKVSWRARPGVDVSGVALQFGGGGHAPAAGATIPGPLSEVQERVLAATRRLLAPQEV
ncbi:MAG TPA: bifunctional oligoribonuclease/PAP phosphatase NrnA [Anaerolineales bacterium]|nr:bifunctional oligoribonuclease/PAP phosphatase NrnA [Anaerolineales bacterium]